jgi:hypothetical protein
MELTRDQIEMAIWRKCLTIMALLFCAQVAFANPSSFHHSTAYLHPTVPDPQTVHTFPALDTTNIFHWHQNLLRPHQLDGADVQRECVLTVERII